jgi:CBS domain-containing protein
VWTVRELMRAEVDVLAATQSVADAARYLASHDVDSVVVCTAEGSVVGSVSCRDIVTQVVAAGRDPEAVRLTDLAGSHGAFVVEVSTPLDEAASLMNRHRLGRLPVVEAERVVGYVHRDDVARSVALQPWTHS